MINMPHSGMHRGLAKPSLADRATLIRILGKAIFSARPQPVSHSELWSIAGADAELRGEDFRAALRMLRDWGAIREVNSGWIYCGRVG